VRGVWSLWEISLSADDFSRRRFLSVFVNDEGRAFLPTAKRIWDLLLTEQIVMIGLAAPPDARSWFERSNEAAQAQGERVFTELVDEHRSRIQEELERAQYAYDARRQAIGRIGLANVREYRRKRLLADHEARLLLLLAEHEYQIYLTADHGNVEAQGIGRPSQGVVSEIRGERVRTYRSEALAASVPAEFGAFRFDIPGLPTDFLPLYARTGEAFVLRDDQIVAHGGLSVEELVVPFIKINFTRDAS
jgi:hypothetical protein